MGHRTAHNRRKGAFRTPERDVSLIDAWSDAAPGEVRQSLVRSPADAVPRSNWSARLWGVFLPDRRRRARGEAAESPGTELGPGRLQGMEAVRLVWGTDTLAYAGNKATWNTRMREA